VEGGAQTHGVFFDLGLVDELLLYLAPLLMGGERSKGLIAGKGAPSMLKLMKLKNLKVSQVGVDLKVQGDVQRDR
jgi:diaminohydroxyphosphoribosylaminopyrimidine deaminase/5-amino-6-(5-phosphoribosylamino)uracil reductase